MNNVTKHQPVVFSLYQWIGLSCSFSYFLLCGRVIATGYFTYGFLLWNLFLAAVPFIISHFLHQVARIEGNNLRVLALLAAWLFFVPNAFYIMTDLFHFRHIQSAPEWYDLLLLLSFAWNGLLMGLVSLRRVEQLFSRSYGKSWSLAMIFGVMWLNALGVYIGRYLRYNSWDVVANPFRLLHDTALLFVWPFDNAISWLMILCYACFMTFIYTSVRKMADQFNTLS